jgi:hypothetical protein
MTTLPRLLPTLFVSAPILAAQLSPPPAQVLPCDGGRRHLFADLHELLPPVLPATGAVSGDVDGDGDPDVLLAAGMQWLVRYPVLWRNEDGRLRTDADALPAMSAADDDAIALVDLDLDGDLDATYGLQALINDGSGHFTLAPAPLAWTRGAAVPVAPPGATPGLSWTSFDLDRDGDLDALGLRASWESGGYGSVAYVRNELLLNDGLGHLLRAELVTRELPHVDYLTAATLADFDGDGDLDALRGDVNWNLHVSEGDGRGRFAPSRVLSSFRTPHIPQALEAGDFDGDGDEDLLVVGSDRDGDSLTLWRMGAPDPAPEPMPSYGDFIAVGDYDADGDPDLLVGSEGLRNWPEQLLRNDGTGHFTVDASFPLVSTSAHAVHLADLEGDGDLDAWIAGTPVRILRNDQGTWSELAGSLPSLAARGLACGDLDRDGDLDFVVSDVAGVYRCMNLGAAGFGALQLLPIGGTSLALLDGDLDGDLDLFSSSADAPAAALENDGRGGLVPAAWVVPMPIAGTALGDVDFDGDLDVLRRDGLRVSLARELAWRTPAKLGRDLELDVHGPPFLPWIVFAAAARAPRDIWTAFGAWRLDPTSARPMARGRTCASGSATIAFAVPADPALLGQSVYWQAAVGSPPHLTNLDTTLLSGF